MEKNDAEIELMQFTHDLVRLVRAYRKVPIYKLVAQARTVMANLERESDAKEKTDNRDCGELGETTSDLQSRGTDNPGGSGLSLP